MRRATGARTVTLPPDVTALTLAPQLDAAGLAPFTAWHVLTHTTGIADIDLEQLLLEAVIGPS